MRVNVTITGNTAILKKLQVLPAQARQLVSEAIEDTTTDIHRAAVSRVPVDTGRLKGSLTPVVLTEGPQIVGEVGTNVEYAPYMEFGTRSNARIPAGLESYAAQFKGSRGGGKDFEEAITEWMRKKGIPEEARFPIMMKLLKVGVRPQPFLFPAFFENVPKFLGRLNKELAKLVS